MQCWQPGQLIPPTVIQRPEHFCIRFLRSLYSCRHSPETRPLTLPPTREIANRDV